MKQRAVNCLFVRALLTLSPPTSTTPFDEIVCSSADSGKLTYWYGKHQLFTTLSQPIFIVNLNSANDNISYPCALPPRFAALNMAMISLAEDYSLVGFKTLAVEVPNPPLLLKQSHALPASGQNLNDQSHLRHQPCNKVQLHHSSLLKSTPWYSQRHRRTSIHLRKHVCALLKRCGGDEGDTK